MTPAEIQALIDANEAEEAILRSDLQEAESKLVVDNFFTQLDDIHALYDADTITAMKAQSEIETLLS